MVIEAGPTPFGAPSLDPIWRRWRVVLIVVAVVWLAAMAVTVTLLVDKFRPTPIRTGSLPGDLGMPRHARAAFADPENGYLLLGRCPTEECETWVAATHDGGRSWDGAIVPGLTFERDARAGLLPWLRIIALDGQHAVLDASADLHWTQDDGLITEPGQRWSTSDGGRSWSNVELGQVDVVDRVPAGAYVRSDGLSTEAGTYLRLIRADGTTAVVVATDDRLAGSVVVLTQVAVDGSVWFVVGDPSEHAGNLILATQDAGRSWAELAVPPEAGQDLVVNPTDGRTLYLVDRGAARVWRSHDTGTTWQELSLPVNATAFLVTIGLPDGRLLAYGRDTPQSLFLVGVDGLTFEPVDFQFMFQLWALVGGGRTLGWGRDGSVGLLDGNGSFTRIPFGCLGGCDSMSISVPVSRY